MLREPHIGVCECRHCDPLALCEWSLDALIPHLAQRAEYDYADPFEEEEAALATLLAMGFEGSAQEAYDLIRKAIGPSPVDLRAVEQALDDSSALMAGIITTALLTDILLSIRTAFENGAADATGGHEPGSRVRLRQPLNPNSPVLDSPAAIRVVEHTAASVAHYTERFYGHVLLPTLRERVAAAVGVIDATEPVSPEIVEAAVDRAFSQRGYWKLVANAATSRAYHYGFLKAAAYAGRRSYRWHSVVDPKTSEVCLTMNGLEFWVADAINTLEGMAATDDPEAATKLMPWLTAEQIDGASPADLRSDGLLVPPAHPHCRSTLVLV